MQLAVHTDINDEDQTIYFPEIKTTAKDADTNSNISCAKEEITLVDTVSFKGLVPNQKYEVTGTLIDKETKKPVEADGKPVTAKASFKPTDYLLPGNQNHCNRCCFRHTLCKTGKRTDAYRPCGIQKPDPRQRVQADRNTHGCGN